MQSIPKWLQPLIARFLPRQDNSGNGVVQIGKMGAGNVTIVHLTQHLPAAPVAPMPTAPAAPPFRPAGVANAEQRQVLQLMRQLPHPGPVHEFMQREFGTHMVIHLQPKELHRVRCYVEKIIQSVAPGSPGARPFEQVQGPRR